MMSILQILSFLLLCLTVTSTVIRYQHQDEYEGFLDLMEQQVDPELQVVKNDFIFDSRIYGTDRHGRPFIKCVERNSSTNAKARNVRCPVLGSTDRPGCFAMYDFTNNEVIQGCYNYQKEIADVCETTPECLLNDRKHVSFCCCVGERCNAAEKVVFRGAPLDQAMVHKQKKRSFHYF